MNLTYKNSAKELTLEQAIKAYEAGIAVIVNDGKDVTLEIEKEPTSQPAK